MPDLQAIGQEIINNWQAMNLLEHIVTIVVALLVLLHVLRKD